MSSLVRRSVIATACAAILALSAAGCGGDEEAAGSPPPGTVWLDDLEFVPETIEVEAGNTVTWEWKEQVAHNVVADSFASETKATGTFTHAFEEAGEYPYVCTLHPGMEGTVVVEPEAP